MQLGDLGADVIKVERPGTGDETRGYGPPFDARGEAAYYLACNRNKLAVAADLDVAADRELIRALVASADIVIDNFKPGTLEQRGLAPTDFVDGHPRLVWCTVTGFGAESARPGYDFVVQAESGWMAVTGERDGAPMKTGVAFADQITGREVVAQVLAALAAIRGGVTAPRRLHVSLYHSAVQSLINVAQNHLVSGAEASRWGNAHANLVPYEMFNASDGPIVICVGNDAQFAALAGVLGSAQLREDRFRTNAGRLAHREDVSREVAARVRSNTAAFWVTALERAGVPAGVVRSVRDAVGTVGASALTGIAPPAPGSVRLPPPRLDEHGSLIRAHGWGAFAHV